MSLCKTEKDRSQPCQSSNKSIKETDLERLLLLTRMTERNKTYKKVRTYKNLVYLNTSSSFRLSYESGILAGLHSSESRLCPDNCLLDPKEFSSSDPHPNILLNHCCSSFLTQFLILLTSKVPCTHALHSLDT